MTDTIYRKANIEDLDLICKLKDEVKELIVKTNLDIWQKDYPTRDYLKTDIERGYARVLVLNDEVVAYMALIPTDDDYGPGFYKDYNLLSYSRIMTSPNYRGKGFGKFMIQKAIEEAKEAYQGMAITVDDINYNAVNLYKSFGFVKIGNMNIPEAKNTLDKYILLFDDILICRALKEDAEALLEYLKKVGSETNNLTFGCEGPNISIDEEKAFIEKQNQDDRSIMLVAKDKTKIVACANINSYKKIRERHVASIGISVLKEYWGKGIGTAILQDLIEFAKSKNIEIITLMVKSDNVRAIKLYQKLGFIKTGEFKKMIKIDDQYFDIDYMNLYLNK